jgi:hypothetical protein
MDELAHRLAFGIVGACLVLDPSLVVLAGTVATEGGAGLAARVERELTAIAPRVNSSVTITEIRADLVLNGALLTAVDAARQELFELSLLWS